jgi:hypothetical protein
LFFKLRKLFCLKERLDRKVDEFTGLTNKKVMKLEEELQRNVNKLSNSTDVNDSKKILKLKYILNFMKFSETRAKSIPWFR